MFIIFWLLFCILVSVYAHKKGRSALIGFLLAFFLSPLIGFFIVLIMSNNQMVLQRRGVESGLLKHCPHCAEVIKGEASVCRHCQRDL